MRVGLYARISADRSEPDELDTPVDRQVKECRDYAQREGWDVVEVFEDRGRSAYRRVRRPAYEALLDAVRGGRIDAVLVWKLDRLHRRVVSFYSFLELLKEHDVKLVSKVERVDTTSPFGEALLGVMSVMSQLEAATMGERSRSKRAAMREAGRRRVGGYRMYGFEKDGTTVRPKEVRLIRRSAQLVAEGASLRAVTRLWAKRGVLTSKGKPVPPQTIRQVLMNSPHVDENVQLKVRAIFEDNSRLLNTGGFNRRRYLLSGAANGYQGLRCAECDEQLVARPGDGFRLYVCHRSETSGTNGCGKVRVRADHIERWVIEEINAHFYAVQGPDREERVDAREAELSAAIRRTREQLDELADQLADEVIDNDQAKRMGDRYRQRVKALQAELAALAKAETTRRIAYDWTELQEQVARFERSYANRGWDEYPEELEYWRSGIEATVKRVVIKRNDPKWSRTWDPGRVEIVWREFEPSSGA